MLASGQTAWLEGTVPKQQRLTGIMVTLLTNLLNENGVDYLSVTGRTKSIQSAQAKIDRKQYANPAAQLTDISGIRVVTFFESHVSQISEIVRRSFEIDEENSMDQDRKLGQDRLGYRSVHFVCCLGANRATLPEYHSLENLKFELQVRTVLQHAWAELAHDRSYKFAGELPSELQRNLNLYSGMLEVVDRGFDEIALKIDEYKSKIGDADIGLLNESEIDSITLEKFVELASHTYEFDIELMGVTKEIVDEVRQFGITRVGELQAIFDDNFRDTHKKHQECDTSWGFIRSVLMFNNLERYMDRSFKYDWSILDLGSFHMLADKFGADNVSQLMDRYEIDVDED